MMKKILFIYILLLGISANVFAQQNITVTGVVIDSNKEPLIGVNVSVSNSPGLGTITDMDGRFSIKMQPYNTLVFSYIGYEKAEVLVKEQRVVNVTMKESSAFAIDEVVVTATGVQKKVTVTGAIATINVADLTTGPSTSIANNLAGVVPGVMAMQTSGKPGSVAEFWIRGISTFGASTAALVLVDGFERDLNEVSVEDIESFSVLKDASATAIYGSKGANGVVLINTRRGKEGKINISAKLEGFYNQFTQVPKFVDGYTYASMANEAKITRNEEPLFQPEELEIFRLGLDPDIYPNVDWMDTMLRDGAFSTRATLNMSGGGKTARYYVSGSYQDQEGMYKTDKSMKDYNTNANYRKWTYRLNVDIDITKTTLLKVGVSGSLQTENDPGVGSNAIWTALMGYNSISAPLMYSDGKVPSMGFDEGDRFNPWVQATMTGYNETWKNNIQTNINLDQKLDFLLKGLRFVGRFGYDTNNTNNIRRFKYPEMWKIKRQRDQAGEPIYERIVAEKLMEQSSGSNGNRREFLEAELHYDHRIDTHQFGATLKYNQASKVQTQGIGDDIKNGIARRNQGLAGRVHYNWNYRYFIDFNFGYNGSENFHKDNRFGFFPAISGAWNIAEEPIIKKAFPWMNMFKLRYSYGKTGLDELPSRFPYVYTMDHMWEMEESSDKKKWQKKLDSNGNPIPTGGYTFADFGFDRKWQGLRYEFVASPYVTWEIATKQDLGIDFSLFNDKLTGAIDYFEEDREGIYMERKYLPWSAGIEVNKNSNNKEVYPSANVGIVKTRGFDGNIALKQQIGQVNLTLRGNFTYSKNEVIEKDEENTVYTYKLEAGHRLNQAMGLVSLGLFKDYEEIRNSPKQTYGDVMPGDIKYKDVNGDGVIDDNDKVAIGATTKPNLTYGFGLSANWKGFNVSVLFQGVGKSTYFINGTSVYMFSSGENWGNILKDMATDRWISKEISGDPATENTNAAYPRLTYGDNKNNNRASTFWLRDGSYLRLKTVDIGYSLPRSIVNKAHFNDIRFFFIGTNLLTFSKFKYWDPEMGSSHGKNYPLNKTYSLGVAINL